MQPDPTRLFFCSSWTTFPRRCAGSNLIRFVWRWPKPKQKGQSYKTSTASLLFQSALFESWQADGMFCCQGRNKFEVSMLWSYKDPFIFEGRAFSLEFNRYLTSRWEWGIHCLILRNEREGKKGKRKGGEINGITHTHILGGQTS